MPPKAQAARDIPRWAEALKKRRSQLGLSQEEVARKCGEQLAQRTVSALENGVIHLTDLSVARLIALSRALSWTLYDLQQATRLDLGIETPQGRLSPAPVQSLPLYPLSEASKPLDQMVPFKDILAPVWLRDLRPGLKVFFEGISPTLGGKMHHIDTLDQYPEPDHAYLILDQDHPIICAYQESRSRDGIIGVFVTPQNRFLPAEAVSVLGKRYVLSSIERH